MTIGGLNSITGSIALWHNNSEPITFDLVFTSTLNGEDCSNYYINCSLSKKESIVTPIGYSHNQMSVHLQHAGLFTEQQCQFFVKQNKNAFNQIRRNSNLYLMNKIVSLTIPYNPGTTALHNTLSNAVVRVPTFDYATAVTFLTKLYYNVCLIHCVSISIQTYHLSFVNQCMMKKN